MKAGPDEIDLWGIDWAHQRRIMLGIVPGKKIDLRDRIGKMRCTLADWRDGAEGTGRGGRRIGENGHPDQDWPEVYTGMSLLVHQAYYIMPLQHRDMMNLHYVWREVWARVKAREIKISLPQYWIRVGNMKSFLFGVIAANGGNVAAIPQKSSRRPEAAVTPVPVPRADIATPVIARQGDPSRCLRLRARA